MNRQTEMQTGEEYGGGRREMTVKSLCEIWEASVRSSVKPSTYACYVTLIEKHIQAELGNMSAGKLTNRVILEFVRKKQRQGLSAGTVRLPRQLSGGKNIMEWEDFHKILSYLLHSRRSFDLGLLISLSTGIRVGELCGIKWGDIDLKAGILRVRRTVSRIRNVDIKEQQKPFPAKQSRTIIQIGPPKTETSVRDIPLPQFLVERLRERQEERRFSSQAYVLTGRAQFMEPRGVQRRFKNLLKKCGIEPVNIHSLRHSFASKWIENGFDSKALSEILGHSSVKITMDIYVHSSTRQKKSYMDRVLDGL